MVQRRKNNKKYTAPEFYHPSQMMYEETEEDLTATAGLGPILDLFLDSPLYPEFCKCLPQRVSNASYDTEVFGLMLLAGFFVGYDCLDDLEYFESNPLILQRFGFVPTAKAFGDWLRDFESEEIEKLREFLRHHAQFARKQIKHGAEKYFRADSAFCNQDCLEECVRMGAKLTITAQAIWAGSPRQNS